MEIFTALAIGLLFAIGIYQMMRRNVIRSVIGWKPPYGRFESFYWDVVAFAGFETLSTR